MRGAPSATKVELTQIILKLDLRKVHKIYTPKLKKFRAHLFIYFWPAFGWRNGPEQKHLNTTNISTTMRRMNLSICIPLLLLAASVEGSRPFLSPAEKLARIKKFIAKFDREHPSPDKYKQEDHEMHLMGIEKQEPYEKLKQMRQRIQEVKASVPSDELDNATNIRQHHIPSETSTTHAQDKQATDETKNDSPIRTSPYAMKYKKTKQFVANINSFDPRSEDTGDIENVHDRDDHHETDTVMRLTLTKPLGILLDADIEDEAIVLSLDDEYPGAAHELSKHDQEKLVGRRIVMVNDEDVRELSLMAIAKRIISSDSPVKFNFETVENDNVLLLSMSQPFGFILDADQEDKAIVFSLDNEYPGTAHKLPKDLQQKLVGRQIIAVNGEDVSDLSLITVVERMVNADNPVELQFAIVDEEKEESQEDEAKFIDYFDEYLVEPVVPGQLSPLKWKGSQQVIDPYAGVVGLPSTLVPIVQAYASSLGIIEKLKDILYNNPCDPESGQFYKTENPHTAWNDNELPFMNDVDNRNELSWYAQRPGKHWHSDMHWFAGSDEYTHESMVQLLLQGGLGQVLEAIGNHYDLDGLFIQSVGFLGVTHCEEGFLHDDFRDVDGRFFNLLVPVYSPEGASEELNVAGERNAGEIVGTKIKYDPQFGVLVGDRALHGTREVDHRPQNEIRVVLSIYLADINESNVDKVSSDETAIFPVPHEATDWLWTQRGRHWQKDQCIASDTGRRPFKTMDSSLRCSDMAKSGECESKAKFARKYCPQSCRVYIDDEEYKSGAERRDIMGDFDFVVE